jgi:hypothetical protein
MHRPFLTAAALCVALGLTACGSSSDTQTVTQVTVVKTESAAPASNDAAPEDAGQATSAPVQEEVDTAEASASTGEAPGGDVSVPNVVGKNHQLAQDTMQDAGLYNLAEEDATGQDRPLLWDRNWVVVSQSPAAGDQVSSDKTVTLRSKKVTD